MRKTAIPITEISFSVRNGRPGQSSLKMTDVQLDISRINEKFSKEAGEQVLKRFQGWLMPGGSCNVGYQGRTANSLHLERLTHDGKKTWAVMEDETSSGRAMKEGRHPQKKAFVEKKNNPNRTRFKGGRKQRTNTFNYGPSTLLGRIQAWVRAKGLSTVTAPGVKPKNSKKMLRAATFLIARSIMTQGSSLSYAKRGLPFTTRHGKGVFDFPQYYSSHESRGHLDQLFVSGGYLDDISGALSFNMRETFEYWLNNYHRTGYYKAPIPTTWEFR